MKRTAIAIAVGALSTGLTHGVLAQDEDAQLREQQQVTEEDEQFEGEGAGEPGETGFDPQDQGQQPYSDEDNAEGENQAEVRVEEGSADVDVEQEPAEVQVEQEPPDVTVEQQPPEVTIEQQDPNVNVEQAEPNVTVEETGEADVEVQPADEAEAELRDPDEQDQATQDQEAQGQGIQVSELESRDLINQDGEELGDIDRVVRNTQSNETYVIVTEGGFLGFGEDEMAYPVSDLEIRSEGEVVLQSQSGERSPDDFDKDDFERLDGDERLDELNQN